MISLRNYFFTLIIEDPYEDNVENIALPQVPEMATQSPQLSPSTSYPTLLPNVECDGPKGKS